jgi:hypothetical protein
MRDVELYRHLLGLEAPWKAVGCARTSGVAVHPTGRASTATSAPRSIFMGRLLRRAVGRSHSPGAGHGDAEARTMPS